MLVSAVGFFCLSSARYTGEESVCGVRASAGEQQMSPKIEAKVRMCHPENSRLWWHWGQKCWLRNCARCPAMETTLAASKSPSAISVYVKSYIASHHVALKAMFPQKNNRLCGVGSPPLYLFSISLWYGSVVQRGNNINRHRNSAKCLSFVMLISHLIENNLLTIILNKCFQMVTES